MMHSTFSILLEKQLFCAQFIQIHNTGWFSNIPAESCFLNFNLSFTQVYHHVYTCRYRRRDCNKCIITSTVTLEMKSCEFLPTALTFEKKSVWSFSHHHSCTSTAITQGSRNSANLLMDEPNTDTQSI